MNQVSSKPTIPFVTLSDARTTVELIGADIHITQPASTAGRLQTVVITRADIPAFLQTFLSLYDQITFAPVVLALQLRRAPEGLHIHDASGVGVMIPRTLLDAFLTAFLALVVNNEPVAL